MAPETRYAPAGKLNIAYQVFGHGPIDLVLVPGWLSNIEVFWEEPNIVRFFEKLATFSRLILFDKRGTGLSDRGIEAATLEERMDDVRAVLDAVGSTKAALLGYSEGGTMCILFAATYPDRTPPPWLPSAASPGVCRPRLSLLHNPGGGLQGGRCGSGRLGRAGVDRCSHALRRRRSDHPTMVGEVPPHERQRLGGGGITATQHRDRYPACPTVHSGADPGSACQGRSCLSGWRRPLHGGSHTRMRSSSR
jgi:hypothetical protein